MSKVKRAQPQKCGNYSHIHTVGGMRPNEDGDIPITHDMMPAGYPHYKVELQTVFEESVTTTTLSNGLNLGPTNLYDESIGFEIGKTYDVIYDGVTYTCKVYGFTGLDNCPCVGNSSLGVINSAVTDEPFLIVHMGKYLVHYTAEPGDHTCVFKEHVTVPVPMAEEFLPAGIGGGGSSGGGAVGGIAVVTFVGSGSSYTANGATYDQLLAALESGMPVYAAKIVDTSSEEDGQIAHYPFPVCYKHANREYLDFSDGYNPEHIYLYPDGTIEIIEDE